jgi:hypothetical protein
LDVETGEATTLIESDRKHYTTEGWMEPGQIWLRDDDGQYWSLHAATGQVIPAHEPEDLRSLSLPEPDLRLQVPAGYALQKSTEGGRRGSFVSYNLVGVTEPPHLYEIQFFSEASIRRFTANCEEPCFYGDFPDIARYRGQKAAFEQRLPYRHYDLQRFGNRHFFVSNLPCEGDTCVIREYTTFLSDTKIDIWVLMRDSGQSLQSDILFSASRIDQAN